MSDEPNESSLSSVHSDVFPSVNDDDGRFRTDSLEFVLPVEEQQRGLHTDDDGDLDVCRPERMRFTLGIRARSVDCETVLCLSRGDAIEIILTVMNVVISVNVEMG